MSSMSRALICLIALTFLALHACQIFNPYPVLPPPGPVRTSEDAIRIAINGCKNILMNYPARWTAELKKDVWIATYKNPRENTAGLYNPLDATAQIRARDGQMLDCSQTIVVTGS